MFLRTLFLSTIILFTHFATADETADKAEFKKLYAEFNDLYANSEELDPIIKVGEKLYELTPKAYGKNHKNNAVITYNLASLYLEKAEEQDNTNMFSKSAELFRDYFDFIDDTGAPKDRDYVYQYLQYIGAMSREGRSGSVKRHTAKIRKIAKSIDYSLAELAEIEFSMGINLFRDGDTLSSLKYFKKANEYYNEAYGSDHFKTGETAFWIAKIEMAQRKRQKAEEHFLSALNVFEKNKEISSDLSQSTHAFLVGLYEDMGQSDKATMHCKAVAEERPKDFDRFITPLYRKQPEMPKLSNSEAIKMKKESVNVLLEFDVDEDGYTNNIRVVESDSQKFNRNSIKATEGFRYAPRVENGEIVETKGAQVLIIYRIAK